MSRLTLDGTAETVSRDQILVFVFPVQPTTSRIGNLTRSIHTQSLAIVVVVVFFTLTDRASTIPNNTRGCQSGTWSAGQKICVTIHTVA